MLYPKEDSLEGFIISKKFLKEVDAKLGEDSFGIAKIEMVLIALERALDDPDK